MADLNDTYVVHTATTTCNMGMRSSCAVLPNSHGVYLRQQPQMTVDDSLPMINVMCFGGCYSMENPSTQAAAAAMQAAVLVACPDTFLDKVMNLFTGGKKKAQTQAAQAGVPRVVGVCTPTIPPGTKWDNGKDGVQTKGKSSLLGGAKIRCLFGGKIQIVDSGQVEGAGSAESYENENGEGADGEGMAGASAGAAGAGAAGASAGAAEAGAGATVPGASRICTGAAAVAAAAVREVGAAAAKEQLKTSLKTAVDNNISLQQRIISLPFYSSEEAMEVVLSHDAHIKAASLKYGVEKELIQAVLFQEQRLYDIGDSLGDIMVRQSQIYDQQMEMYENADLLVKAAMGMPQPPVIYRHYTSTGLGQIQPLTAIDATNQLDDTNYDPYDNETLSLFWNKLQDDDYNLDMIGKVLKVKTQYAKKSLAQKGEGDREPTPWEVMKAYNGSGDDADTYANAAVQYYEAFREYNSALEKLGGQR